MTASRMTNPTASAPLRYGMAASSWRSSAGFVSVNHVVVLCVASWNPAALRAITAAGSVPSTSLTAVNSGSFAALPCIRRNAARLTKAPVPRRGMSVPIWLTGGKVARPTTRRFTASPVGLAPVSDAARICTGTRSPSLAPMPSRVSWPTTISLSARGPRPRRIVGVSSPFTRVAASPGTARPLIRNEPDVNPVAATTSSLAPKAWWSADGDWSPYALTASTSASKP